MLSWITGPRITNVIEDLQTDPAYDTTFVEPPETPAHQFAVKAFKHALFGTPAAEQAANPGKKLEKKAKLDAANTKSTELLAPKETAPPLSPSKQPGGILLTPGTANKGRKTVSFGAQVVDNEGKRANAGKSGVPNDCPGKFPSPWTPGTELKADADKDKKPRNKLTAALLDARTTTQPKPGQKPKARDDSDITLDLGAPRSESGKYWKAQYESYAEKSEKEMKKLIAKQQLAKNFAKKKDSEMTEVATRLDEERRRFRQRERELEMQNKDYQERLRQAMAENVSTSVEITALKNRISVLEKSFVARSSEVQNSKISFDIYEDSSKNSTRLRTEQEKDSRSRDPMDPPSTILGRPVQSTRVQPEEKENSPPKPRRTRRQPLPDASSRPTTSRPAVSQPVTDSIEASATPAKLPTASIQPYEPFAKSTLTSRTPELPSKSALSIRKPDPSKENLPPKSPAALLPSSPLPQPSPDPWMDINESPLPQLDRLALPISGGPSYSNPVKSSQPRPLSQHRISKSVSNVTKLDAPEAPTDSVEKAIHYDTRSDALKTAQSTQQAVPTDPKFDVAKTASHHDRGFSLAAKDRASLPVDRKEQGMLPVDRKEQARRRLLERKQKRLAS